MSAEFSLRFTEKDREILGDTEDLLLIASYNKIVKNEVDLRDEYVGGPFTDIRYLSGEIKLSAAAFDSPFSLQDSFWARPFKVEGLSNPVQFTIPKLQDKTFYNLQFFDVKCMANIEGTWKELTICKQETKDGKTFVCCSQQFVMTAAMSVKRGIFASPNPVLLLMVLDTFWLGLSLLGFYLDWKKARKDRKEAYREEESDRSD